LLSFRFALFLGIDFNSSLHCSVFKDQNIRRLSGDFYIIANLYATVNKFFYVSYQPDRR